MQNRAIALAMAISLLPAPSHADEARDIAAFECLAAFGGASESSDKDLAESSIYGNYFYNGRLDPALTEAQRLERARRAMAGVTAETIQPILDRCIAEIEQANDRLNKTIGTMQENGEARH